MKDQWDEERSEILTHTNMHTHTIIFKHRLLLRV